MTRFLFLVGSGLNTMAWESLLLANAKATRLSLFLMQQGAHV